MTERRCLQLSGYLERKILSEVDFMQVETLKDILHWKKSHIRN